MRVGTSARKEFQSSRWGSGTLACESFSFSEMENLQKPSSLSGEKLYLIISLRFHPSQIFSSELIKAFCFTGKKKTGDDCAFSCHSL